MNMARRTSQQKDVSGEIADQNSTKSVSRLANKTSAKHQQNVSKKAHKRLTKL